MRWVQVYDSLEALPIQIQFMNGYDKNAKPFYIVNVAEDDNVIKIIRCWISEGLLP